MNSTTRDIFNEQRYRDVSQISMMVFKRVPNRVAFPGGSSRSAFVADMGDASYIFAKRSNIADAKLEAYVLRALGETGLVPKLWANEKRWVVQECLPGQRLPVALNETTSMAERGALVSKALESLLHIQEAGMAKGLQRRIPEIGTGVAWAWKRTGAAKRMSKQINILEPQLDRQWLTNKLEVKRSEFTKWDARPGNSLVNGDAVAWFDWEDCGRGCGLDDLAFVLCDEWTSLDADTESQIEQRFLPLFNRIMSLDEAHEYLRVFGLIHIVIRLRMALKYRVSDGRWWNRQYCLRGDKVGVTAEETARLISRGKRLADDVYQLRAYIPWLDEIAHLFDIPDCKEMTLSKRVA